MANYISGTAAAVQLLKNNAKRIKRGPLSFDIYARAGEVDAAVAQIYTDLTALDSAIAASNELSEILSNGASTGGTDITVSTGDTIVESLETGITAFAGGGQANAVLLTEMNNDVTTVATAGDSVKLPAASVGLVVKVKNSGANAMDVFPNTSDSIDAGGANAAVSVPAGCMVTFTAKDATVWETAENFVGGFVVRSQGGAGGPYNSISSDTGKTLVHLDDAAGNGYFEVTTDNYGFAEPYFWIADETGAGGAGTTVFELFLKAGHFNVVTSGPATEFSVTPGAVHMRSKVIQSATTTSSGAGAVGITGSIHEITTTGTGDALTLANGTEGQRLAVVYVAEGAGADTAVLTPTSLAGGTTITFNALGDTADLLFTAGAWYMMGGSAVIA